MGGFLSCVAKHTRMHTDGCSLCGSIEKFDEPLDQFVVGIDADILTLCKSCRDEIGITALRERVEEQNERIEKLEGLIRKTQEVFKMMRAEKRIA